MKCTECGSPMSSSRENHRYVACGLDQVTLMGVEVHHCSSCENWEVAIPQIEALHELIARTLIEKPTRLTAREIRFLRKRLGWSGASFARHMGVAAETVSRWENDALPIGPQADRLLRLMVARGQRTDSYPTERLASIDAARATVTRLQLRSRSKGWELLSA